MLIRRPISQWTRIVLGVVSILTVIGAYCVMSYRVHQRQPQNKTIPNLAQFVQGWQRIMPKRELPAEPSRLFRGQEPRSEYLAELKRYWEKFPLAIDVATTLWRLAVGVVAGVALSVVVGITMGCFPFVEALLGPPIIFFAKIPPTAMLAVYFVIFGIKFPLYIGMIALGIFPTLTPGIYQAAKKDVTDHAIYKAYTLGASQMEVIWNVIIPQILPRVIESIRLQIGPAMIFLIAAEYAVGGDAGLGYRIRMEQKMTNMNVVYIYLIILGIIGFAIDYGLAVSRRRLSPWFGE